jgi:hypothetical protein
MKSIKQVLWILALCTSSLFFSKNANAQCSGFNLTASKTADGTSLGDVTVTATITGGSGGLTWYTWHTSSYSFISLGATKSSLIAGSYCVTVLDSSSSAAICLDTFCLTVTDTGTFNCADMVASFNIIDTCPLNDVYVSIWTTGGSGSYTYQWNTSLTDTFWMLSNKTTGSYSVIVTDKVYGCKDTFYKTVVDDTCNICDSFKNNGYIGEIDPCQKNDVTLTAHKWAGSQSYFYLWNNGATTQSISNKGGGSYWVKITDTLYGCVDTLFITVTDDTCSPCQYFNAWIYENDPCQKNDIILIAYPQDSLGTTRYKYLWNTGATSMSLTNRGAGTYWVKVTDSILGCVDTAYIAVADDTCNPCAGFNAYVYKTDSCKHNDVKLTAYGKGNFQTQLFHFQWNTGKTASNVFSSSIDSQTSGSYWVKVVDITHGCIDTAYISIIDDTCSPCNNFGGYMYKYDSCKANDLKIYAYAWGGSGNYSYSWNTGSTASLLTNRATGWYKVTITDNVYGCTYIDSIYVLDSNFRCCQAWFYTNDSAVASTKTFYGQNSMLDSTAGSTTYSWNFGDGNTGTGQTKNHTYTSSGNKTVCLYINTASGCKDTFCSVVNSPSPGKNLKVSHYGIPYIKDTNRYTYITYQNIGTTTENGIVEYKYPAGMTLVSSTISPLTHIGNKISFSVGSLTPGAGGTIYVVMKTPLSFTLGSVKCDTAIILPISGDIAPSNNSSYECDSVVASWDPNDKTPNPKGIGAEGAISPDTKEIGYLIRFENEGNWRTYRVRVEDEIDPSFDINSLMIGDVSHAFRLVRSGSKMIWYFDNIELTPKSVDPNKSHGYIQYTLQLKSGLALGTQLKNTAYIYFDANPAIITNTTKNTLKNADGSAAVRNLASGDLLDFDLKRNGNKLTVYSLSKMQALRIFDISGKLLLEKEMNSDTEEIENVQLSQSIYIVHVDIDNQTVIKKIKF